MPPKKEKHSAYRSMKLAAEGKSKPTTKENKGALKRWTDEKWLNLNALVDIGKELPCGTKYRGQRDPTVCRPKNKVSEKTPKPLAKDVSKKQVRKAVEIKKKGLNIKWSEL
jgi:hypothetical protein